MVKVGKGTDGAEDVLKGAGTCTLELLLLLSCWCLLVA